MGDRCYLRLVIRKRDEQRFLQLLNGFDDPLPTGYEVCDRLERHFSEIEEAEESKYLELTVYEANYSWYDDRCHWAACGLEFSGHHYEGGEYGAYRFAAVDGEMHEAPIYSNGDLIVFYDEQKHQVIQSTVEMVERFLQADRAFWEKEIKNEN